MISRIKGKLVRKEERQVFVDIGGICYEIDVPRSTSSRLQEENGLVELVIFHYFNIDGNRGLPVLIGFLEELEKDFFEKFISVSGIGPKAALKALDKPIALIATAIEDGDMDFLRTLDGIGTQKAKQIVASLQGKVGRFALIKEEAKTPARKEIVEEAKQVLKRLQYNVKEIDEMIKKAMEAKPQFDTLEDFLNEIYRQRR